MQFSSSFFKIVSRCREKRTWSQIAWTKILPPPLIGQSGQSGEIFEHVWQTTFLQPHIHLNQT